MSMLRAPRHQLRAAATRELRLVPDFELVHRARAGDAVAFELIMRRYNQRLFRLARSVVKSGADAEDVVQETYVRAYAGLGSFVGPSGLGAWLAKIALNEALQMLRRRRRLVAIADQQQHPGGLDDVRDPRPSPERLAASAELRRMIEAAVDELPGEYRIVFMLRGVENQSVAETAALLAIPEATVKTRFHRARRRLQIALGGHIDALLPSTFGFAGAACDRIVARVLGRLGL